MNNYYFVFDYAVVSISLAEANLQDEEAFLRKTKEFINLSDNEIIKQLKVLKVEFDSLPDPTAKNDLLDSEELLEKAEQRARIYLQRQLLTNAYAMKHGSDFFELSQISFIGLKSLHYNWRKEYHYFISDVLGQEINNQDYDEIPYFWEKLVKSGKIPPYGVSNALRYENKDSGFELLPFKRSLKHETIHKLRTKMHEQVARNGNKAIDVYNTILAAYCVGCFYDQEHPKVSKVAIEFDNVKLSKTAYTKVEEEFREIDTLLSRYDIEKRLNMIKDKKYYHLAVEIYELLK